MGLRFRLVKRPPIASVQYNIVRNEIATQLVTVANTHIEKRNKIVSNFDTKIKFGSKIKVVNNSIKMSILVENYNKSVSDGFSVGDLWAALDEYGTKKHDIPKKPGGWLRFQWGGVGSYKPKTSPIAKSGGSGKTSGSIVYRKKVKHPGFKPRKFSETIHNKLKSNYGKAVRKGVQEGFRKANP